MWPALRGALPSLTYAGREQHLSIKDALLPLLDKAATIFDYLVRRL